MANTAIARATYKALSCHGGGLRLDVRVSNPWLIATALSCNAMYGIMPITVTAVTIAASHESLPSRLAIRSASEVALCSRAIRTRLCSKPIPSVYNRSEEHTPELQSLMRTSYAAFCLKKKKDQ